VERKGKDAFAVLTYPFILSVHAVTAIMIEQPGQNNTISSSEKIF
jgi:hypothetical protein